MCMGYYVCMRVCCAQAHECAWVCTCMHLNKNIHIESVLKRLCPGSIVLRTYSRWHTTIVETGLLLKRAFYFLTKSRSPNDRQYNINFQFSRIFFLLTPSALLTPAPEPDTHLPVPLSHSFFKFPSLNKREGWGRQTPSTAAHPKKRFFKKKSIDGL